MYTTPAELILAFRREMHDTVAPYFWSNPELYEYMTQAELVIAQRTMCIQDLTSAATLYDVAADEADVVMHPSIYRIRAAWWLENGGEFKLEIRSLDDMIARGCRVNTQEGRPNTFMTGAVTNGARLYPIPQNAGEVRVAVYRTPLAPLNEQASFEIPIQYRNAMLDWMKFRALSKDDAETFNRESAGNAQRAFEYHMDSYTTSESMRRGGPQNGGISYGGL
jgi:hypothetical protein